MTTSRADLLAGADMEGGENFCDSIYNFLKNQGKDINLFTNSGVGVWSQSDDNKGLAALVFDNGTVAPVVGETIAGANATGKVIWVDVTDAGWAGGDGAGTAYLGAVTGAYEDNEVIAGGLGAAFQVAGDLNIGIKNDPMNDDSRGDWTLEGAGIVLAFGAALYTVTTTAINQHAWIDDAPLVEGKIYKIELDIKSGTDADIEIQGYFDDGAAQYGRTRITDGWASVSWVFECATTTATGKVGFRIIDDMVGSNIQIRRFSCYEITPCCTNDADNLAFDGWHRDATCDIYRQHWDSTYSKCGSFYSLKIVPSDVDDYVIFPLFTEVSDEEYWYKQFCGRPVTIGAWVLTNTASHARVYIGDDVSGAQYSNYHTGGGGWEWLELTFVIDEAATRVLFGFYCARAGDIDGTTIVYISQPMLVFGWSLGEGMYQPRLQEWIYSEKLILSNLLDATTSWSDVVFTDLNIEADSDAKLPKGCKAIRVYTKARDSQSFTVGGDVYVALAKDSINLGQDYINFFGGTKDNAYRYLSGIQPCNENGDVEYRINATGAGNLDINHFRYLGVQVN